MYPIYTETPIILQLVYARLTFSGVKIVKHHAYCTSPLHNESDLHNDYQHFYLNY